MPSESTTTVISRARLRLSLSALSCLSLLSACGGGGGSSGGNNPPPPPVPTVSISASAPSITLGQTVTLTWSSNNATSCTATASPAETDWSGNLSINGSQSVTPSATGSVDYTLSCTGAGGSKSDDASVSVSASTPTVARFLVKGPSTADSGVPFNLTVTALDSGGNTVTSYGGTVHFQSSDSHAQLPPDSSLSMGTASFSAALAVPGAQKITVYDTFMRLSGMSGSITVGAQSFPVELFGAKGDGVTDDTAAIQAAIDAAGGAGGGSVLFKVTRYFTAGTLEVPTGVVLCGTVEGPFDVSGVNPASTAIAPTILVTNNSAPFINLAGVGSGVTDLLFHYPKQVASTASNPFVYPFTIQVNSPGTKVVRSTATNAYNFLDIEIGRSIAQNLFIGAFNIGVNIDNSYDFVTLDNLHNGLFWDAIEGAAYPSTIDSWVLNHGTALMVGQMDALAIHDFYAVSRYAGIVLTASSNTSLPGLRTVWGTGSNIDLENMQFGVIATATNSPGFEFTNLVVTAAPGSGQAAVNLTSGGTNPPDIVVNGGAVRGTWSQGAFPSPASGILTVVNML